MFLFDERYQTFEPFSASHGAAIITLIICFIVLVVFKERIKGATDLYLRRGLVIAMLSLEWTFYVWSLSRSGFETALLPMGMCAISVYVTCVALWTKSQKLFRFILPWALTGALLSLFVADMAYTFPHFRYIHYFGNHSLFLLGNLYLLMVAKFTFTYRHLLKSSLYLLIYTIIIYPVNFLLDSNHLFLRALPEEVASLFDVLGSFWVFGLMATIFLLFHVVYLPIALAQRHIAADLLEQTS